MRAAQVATVLVVWLFLGRQPLRAQSFAVQADSIQRLLARSQPDTNRVQLLLALGTMYVLKMSEYRSDLDTALLLSRQAYTLSHSVGYLRGQGLSYLTAAQAYREEKEFLKGKRCVQRAIDLLTTHGSPSDQAAAYVEQAAYYSISSRDLPKKNRLYLTIIALLEQSGQKRQLADALAYRGDLNQLQGNNQQALTDLRRALVLYQSVGYGRLQTTYDLLGLVYSKVGNYEDGVKYGLLAVKTAEATKDSFLLGHIYNRLGSLYQLLDQPQKALMYFDKCLLVTQNQYYRGTIILLANTISDVLETTEHVSGSVRAAQNLKVKRALSHLQDIMDRRPADRSDIDCRLSVDRCYIYYYSKGRRDYDRAQPYVDQVERLLHDGLGEDHQTYIHAMLIPFYIDSRQFARAHEHLTGNEDICRRNAYTKAWAVNHLWWFQLDSAQANYVSAIGHYQQFKHLTDLQQRELQNQKVAQLEVQNQTQEKEHNIQELTQRSRLQQTALRAAQTTRNVMIVGAVLLLLLLAMSYNRYRLKQHSNQLLEAKQVEINQKNQALEQVIGEKDHLLTEKEWMIKEIHHRVKNNLQIITSLLHSQGMYLKDEAAQSAIQESQNRVHAMALLHQKLYQSDRLAAIPVTDYIAEIVDYLIASFDRERTIRRHIAVAPVDLDVTLAVPLGLILNEAVTNSLKYAFPRDRPGTISVALTQTDRHQYQFVISDDGVGLPDTVNPAHSRTLGMSLMRGLSKQIGGHLHVLPSVQGGVAVQLAFAEAITPSEESVGA